jgi:hypothetical protein
LGHIPGNAPPVEGLQRKLGPFTFWGKGRSEQAFRAIMTIRIGDILARRPIKKLFGRDNALAALMPLINADRPIVAQVRGIPGIGKSALLRQLSLEAHKADARTVILDCRSIEPTTQGFLQAVGAASDLAMPYIDRASEQIGAIAPRVLLLLDHFDAFRLMDGWLCQTFPALPSNVRIATFGRLPPAPHWLSAPEWKQFMINLRLDALAAPDAEALLRDAGVSSADARRLATTGRGHPLALHLAARARLERPDLELPDLNVSSVTIELADITLADITDQPTRHTVEAASIIRRVTEPFLAAIFSSADTRLLYTRLRALPIFGHLHDGLTLHEALRPAVAASLKTANPERSIFYRAPAWRHLRTQIGQASPADLWRYTAAAIYLLENPVIREAFFPSAPQSLTTAPAMPSDSDTILNMVRQHDGADAARHLAAWWSRRPGAFYVVRDTRRKIVGFYCLGVADQTDPSLLVEDPVTAAWWRHARDTPTTRGRNVLFLRRWLSAADGEAPCPVQAACWLDIKRTYLELRPELRYVYLALRDISPYAPVAETLSFQLLGLEASLDDKSYHSAVLDFGPVSVDGWISKLLGAELGQEVGADKCGPLDADARELILDRQRISLTQREFALLQYLHARSSRAVSRDELLADIWGWKVDGGSNVIEALVRALRRKLGENARIIETVRAVGYRYRIPAG